MGFNWRKWKWGWGLSLCAVVVVALTQIPSVSASANVAENRIVNQWEGPKVPILEYHDTTFLPGNAYAMSQQQFADEMQYLHDNGFHTITLDQLHDAMHGTFALPSRPIVITFDDGYESNYTNAFPVLQKYGFHATIFMISSFVGRPGFLTKDELVSMERSGLIDIESHTAHHKNLRTLRPRQVITELTQSRDTLSKLTHHPVKYFCYPDGGYRWADVAMLKKTGYELATTTDEGYASIHSNPYLLRRIPIYSGISTSQFAHLLSPSCKK